MAETGHGLRAVWKAEMPVRRLLVDMKEVTEYNTQDLTRYHSKVQRGFTDTDMNQKLLHTPEGVRDIYGDECARKLRLEEKVRSVMVSYGYDPIETPIFEFFDVFSSNVGTISSRELYKFFDREGNTLALRPDFTPSIARCACKYFMEDTEPIRLWYQGHAFINHSSYQGRMKESTHTGAELIGDGSIRADAEIVAMAIECMKAAGLSDFQISLGHVQYFECLAREAHLDEDTREELRTLIRNKNSFGVGKLLEPLQLPDGIREALTSMPATFGGYEMLDRCLAMAEGTSAAEAVRRLMEVYHLLKAYGLEKYISFDMGMMGSYMYYTGIIFRGFTYGVGDAVVKGGRYDNLLAHFGKEAPSVGFVAVIDQLMNALYRQKKWEDEGSERIVLHYNEGNEEEMIRRACELRKAGKSVVLTHR